MLKVSPNSSGVYLTDPHELQEVGSDIVKKVRHAESAEEVGRNRVTSQGFGH